MKKLANRVKVSTPTTSTGTVTFGAPTSDAFCSPAAAGLADGDVVPYTIVNGTNTDEEQGFGTIGGGETTLSRDTVRISNISGVTGTTHINLDGAAVLFITPSAEDLMFDETHGADIASAGTLNLETSTGGYVHVTGTTTITAVTLLEGHVRWVRFSGACQITVGSSLVGNGGSGNITTAAGDFACFRGDTAGVVYFTHYPISGKSVVPPAGTDLTGTTLAASVVTSSLTALGVLTALSISGQITSTVTTGTAPLVVTSTTNVANLNASSLNGATFAAPGAIGGGTASAITGTTINATTGFQVAGAATSGYVLRGNGSDFVNAQLAFSDLSGAAVAAQLPNPSASGLGGVQSIAAVSHKYLTSISTSGVPALAQPAVADLSDGVTGTSTVVCSASPTLTGTPVVPTATVDTDTGQIASTAFVLGQGSQSGDAAPVIDGTAAHGTSTRFARNDHVHPTDTSRAPLASPALTGTPTAPTASANTNSTQIATTAYLDSKLATASGIATLDGSGKLTSTQIPAALVGALQYQGTWNASTNSPTLTSSTGTKGQYYKVSTAGTTSIDGNAQWNIGDQIIFDGTVWDKVDGLSSEVISVAGRTGAVTLASSDIGGLVASATTDTTNASNISSGTLASARLPAPTTSAIGGVKAINQVSHEWVSYIDTTGTPYLAQPAASDISGLASSATTDTTNAANISSGTLPAARLPSPAVSTLGGVKSNAGTTHEWISAINTDGTVTLSQPAATDISGLATSATTDTTNASNISSGTLSASRLPAPTASTLGGVQSITSASHNWISYIDTSGVPHQSQPAFGDISGNISTSQMNSGTGASSTTFWCGNGTWTAVGGSGLLLSSTTYTSTQTITIPTGATKCRIRMCGSGGGAKATGYLCCGVAQSTAAIGGNPGYLETFLTSLTAGNTLALTIGAAGVGSTTTNAGSTSLASGTQTISTLTCPGGTSVAASGSTQGELNGTSSAPSGGNVSNWMTGTLSLTTIFGIGYFSLPAVNTAVAGAGYGTPAQVTSPKVNASSLSANGAPGVCIIDWYT